MERNDFRTFFSKGVHYIWLLQSRDSPRSNFGSYPVYFGDQLCWEFLRIISQKVKVDTCVRRSRRATTSIRIPGDEKVLPRPRGQSRSSQRNGEASASSQLAFSTISLRCFRVLGFNNCAFGLPLFLECARSKLSAAIFNLYIECLIKIAGT